MEYVMQLLHGWEQLKISPIYFLLFKNPIKGSHGREFVEYGFSQVTQKSFLSILSHPNVSTSSPLHPSFFFFCGTGF
jgi:hypothetical protein